MTVLLLCDFDSNYFMFENKLGILEACLLVTYGYYETKCRKRCHSRHKNRKFVLNKVDFYFDIVNLKKVLSMISYCKVKVSKLYRQVL